MNFYYKNNCMQVKTQPECELEKLVAAYLVATDRKSTGVAIQNIWEWLQQNKIKSLESDGITLYAFQSEQMFTAWTVPYYSYSSIEIECEYFCEGSFIRHTAEFEYRNNEWWCITIEEEWRE